LHYFSSAGHVVNETQSALDADTVNMLVCLRDWWRWHWCYNFRQISITLNWLMILLSLLNSTT